MRYTLVELAEIIADAAFECGLKRPKVILDKQDTSLWAGMDSSRFQSHTGWMPKVELRETVQKYIADLI